MVRHQNLLVIIAVLWLAAVILAVRLQKHQVYAHKNTNKHILLDNKSHCLTIAYGSHLKNQANLLDLWVPEEKLFSQNGLNPVIVLIHGGAWYSGDKAEMPFSEVLNKKGYAVASINYRLTDEASFPAQIEDCNNALDWLHTHAKIFRLDPNRIGIWGYSAGGQLAALLGTMTTTRKSGHNTVSSSPGATVQAICDWSGPTDLQTIAQQAGANYVLSHAVRKLLGGTPEEKPELAKQASPVNFIHKGCPPFLIMHGQEDPTVPLAQSEELFSKLKDAKCDCTLEIIPHAHHNFANDATIAQVTRFFDAKLKRRVK